MKLKFKIICPYCGWETNEHELASGCVKEKEVAHRSKYGGWEAHDIAFSRICPICDEDMGESYEHLIMEE